MNKRSGLIAGAVMVILIVALVYFFSGGEETSGPAAPKFVSDKWETEFVIDSKDPQGLSLFKKLVDNRAKRSIILKDSFPAKPEYKSTYVFAGDRFSLHSNEFDSILKNVSNGCDLFLSFHELTDNIHPYFFKDPSMDWHFDDELEVYTDNKAYMFYPLFQTDTIARRWNLIEPENIVDTSFIPLSSFMQAPNFIQLKLGKGNIYLHTNPELFFNYQMLTKQGFSHAQFIVNRFRKNYTVKWLELGRLTENFGNSDTDQMEGEGGREEDSLLTLLFAHKELLIALLLTILGILLYLIFRTKRYWPAVPYLPKSKNRSLDFADTMTAIYFNQQSPYSILIVMRKNFRANVSRHFFLDISKEEKALEIRLLSEKAGLPLKQVDELVKMLENIKMQAVTYEYVQEAAKRQREFYIATGIIKDKIKKKSEQKKIEFKRQIIVSSGLIFIGLNAIIRGFYMLSLSQGWGILLWPIGFIMVLAGIFLFNRKLIVVENNQLTWYPYFLPKKVYNLNELLDVKVEKGFTTLTFTGNRKLQINHFEISLYSRKDFSNFIAPYIRIK